VIFCEYLQRLPDAGLSAQARERFCGDQFVAGCASAHREVCEPDDAVYRCVLGLIHMCANCRRTRRNGDPEIWDWVPAYVARPRREMTHTICPFCREYYYSAYLEPKETAG